mgnify:CR=1 FL=1
MRNGACFDFYRTLRGERVAKMTYSETDEPDATHQLYTVDRLKDERRKTKHCNVVLSGCGRGVYG